LPDGGGARPLEGDAVAADHFEGFFRQRLAVLLGGHRAGGWLHPLPLHAGRRGHPARPARDFPARPLALGPHDLPVTPPVPRPESHTPGGRKAVLTVVRRPGAFLLGNRAKTRRGAADYVQEPPRSGGVL